MQLDLWATWTSSPAAGPAKVTPSQESAEASRMTEATSGGSSSESSRSRAPRTSSRKTSGALFPSTLDAISELSSVLWMTRGMMLGGSLLPLPPAAPRTSASDSGFSLGAERWATPRANDCKVSTGPQSEMNRDSIVRDVMSLFHQQATITKPVVQAIRQNRPRINAAWVEQVMGWPSGWVTGLPPEVFGRLEEDRRNTRGKRRASLMKE